MGLRNLGWAWIFGLGAILFGGGWLQAEKSPGLQLDALASEVSKNAQNFPSVESLLIWIKSQNPTLFSRFTLVHRSKSLQEGSPTNPRAVVFGPSASLVLTFNGSLKQRGGNAVEFAQFVPRRGAIGAHFQFREVSVKDGRAEVSGANPAKCLRCHGSIPRPIWQPYEIWDGVYGKYDDAIVDLPNLQFASPTVYEPIKEEQATELKNFTEFRKLQPTHLRYSLLELLPAFDDLDTSLQAVEKSRPYGSRIRFRDYDYRPNLRLTKALGAQNAERVLDSMQSSPECYAAVVPQWLAYQRYCEQHAEQKPRMEKLLQEARATLAQMMKAGPAEQTSPRAVFMMLLGLDAAQTNLEFSSKSWEYFSGEQDVFEILGERAANRLASVLPVLHEEPKLGASDGNSEPEADSEREAQRAYSDLAARKCDVLVSYAQEKSSDLAACATHATSRRVALQSATRRLCQSCHGAEDALPSLTTRPPALDWEPGSAGAQKILARITSTDPAKRMPPDRPLSAQELDSLLHALLK